MVLAQAVELNIAHNHHFSYFSFKQSTVQELDRSRDSLQELCVSPGYPVGWHRTLALRSSPIASKIWRTACGFAQSISHRRPLSCF